MHSKIPIYELFEQEEYNERPDYSFLGKEEFIKGFFDHIFSKISYTKKIKFENLEYFPVLGHTYINKDHYTWEARSAHNGMIFPMALCLDDFYLSIKIIGHAPEDDEKSNIYNLPTFQVSCEYIIVSSMNVQDNNFFTIDTTAHRNHIEYDLYFNNTSIRNIEGKFDLLVHKLNQYNSMTDVIKDASIF